MEQSTLDKGRAIESPPERMACLQSLQEGKRTCGYPGKEGSRQRTREVQRLSAGSELAR